MKTELLKAIFIAYYVVCYPLWVYYWMFFTTKDIHVMDVRKACTKDKWQYVWFTCYSFVFCILTPLIFIRSEHERK